MDKLMPDIAPPALPVVSLYQDHKTYNFVQSLVFLFLFG